MFTLVLSPLLLLLLILLLRSDDDRFGRRLRQEDEDFATPTTDDEEAENASACILQIYIYIFKCVCVIKLLRSLKTCGCLSIMCSRSFYIENFIHSDESCLAVHWLVRGNNRAGKGNSLSKKRERKTIFSAFFIREHAPRRRRFLSSALCESRRKKNC